MCPVLHEKIEIEPQWWRPQTQAKAGKEAKASTLLVVSGL